MAFANFFERTATAASQVLSDFTVASYTATLSSHTVGLYFDESAATSPEGRATLDMCARILARLYPAMVIAGIGSEAETLGKDLEALCFAINARLDLSDDVAQATVAIIVGETFLIGDVPKIYIGSDGWRARLSRVGPVGSGSTANPFGAGAAACFAAANVFRLVFADQLVRGDLDQEIDVSLFDYRHESGPGPQLPERLELGDAYLAGLGAIGHGAMWALGRLPGLAGTLHTIDHDEVDLSNLQRYVMAVQKDVGTSKSNLSRKLLKREGLRIAAHPLKWSDFVSGRRNRSFERVAVALDNAADRIGIQASLPRWIVNAWTQELDLGISRHGFDDEKACLACLYLPSGIVKSEDERVADELRIPEAKQEVRELLQKGEGVPENFVQRVATAFSVPFPDLQPFVGEPLRTFHQKAVCGGMMIGLTGTGNAGTAVVPMAFQSALAGIGLAADLVKHAAGLPMPESTITRINLLRPLAPILAEPRARDATGRCICRDHDFLDAYRRKYAVGARQGRVSRRQ